MIGHSGGPVTLVTTTNGTNVKIANRYLRIIIDNDEIQYAFEKEVSNGCPLLDPSKGFNWMQPTLEKAARTLVKCGKKSEHFE